MSGTETGIVVNTSCCGLNLTTRSSVYLDIPHCFICMKATKKGSRWDEGEGDVYFC